MLLTALPVSAAIDKGKPTYGAIVMTVEKHFEKADFDNSGLITKAEYIAISSAMKNQAEKEAGLDFNAMDINGDGTLNFEEFYGELPSALTV
jgi:Ca2+-binding EF-hand superfamily protein